MTTKKDAAKATAYARTAFGQDDVMRAKGPEILLTVDDVARELRMLRVPRTLTLAHMREMAPAGDRVGVTRGQLDAWIRLHTVAPGPLRGEPKPMNREARQR